MDNKQLISATSNNNDDADKLTIRDPELIFGIVGPIGVDIDSIVASLGKSLRDVGYNACVIHLTKHIKDDRIPIEVDERSYYSRYKTLIKYGNEFRALAKNASAIAGIAIAKIREIRAELSNDVNQPALGRAYIIRQFKRAEEVALMRRVYGRKFIQVSVFGSPIDRRRILIEKIQSYDASPKNEAEVERQAIELIDVDHNQRDHDHGQRLSDVFHLGDVFVDGIHKVKAQQTIDRFIRAFFGDTSASPTKDEYGLYIATAASLRSVDLSRQVGAAIFSKRGEIITLGCNEVPKADGGTYWSDDPRPIARDVELGRDPNQSRKNEIIYDLLDRMFDEGLLSAKLTSVEDKQARIDTFLGNARVKDAQILDIIEYGRIIHAEMSAISDAARLGRETAGSTLYCTTFPCHLCAKHIVAAGMKRVVFLEPYPKSYAQKLHSDSITFDGDDENKVFFQPFIGISPRRYRDIFEKRKRKDSKGKAIDWYEGQPIPLLEDRSGSYIENEEAAVVVALKELFQGGNSSPNPG
ncbi:anti-phage dCTP deaminase [Microvirga sp. 2MCAF38]|uniref:anti-phage dCTP deaminase n=1 Tax=Microvirga sp. 2MCAF38 TaxID=3232989 RepID=UPI003F9A399E